MPSPDEFSPHLRSHLRAALDLDRDERAYLTQLNLAAAWRMQTAVAKDSAWGWLALLAVASAFLAWSVVVQPLTAVLDTADLVSIGTLALTNLVGLLLSIAGGFIDLASNPALGLTQPMLALAALALLFWPRIASAPHYLQGERS